MFVSGTNHGGSPSLLEPDYWWYRARARMLRLIFDEHLPSDVVGPLLALDVGSADGPSGFWTGRRARVVSADVDPRGLADRGMGARIPDLPFRDATFDVVTAFDVIEHCQPESDALAEVARVIRTGGRLLLSVPAYEWAWTEFDVANGHYRRYTKRRATRALESSGFRVLRATHAFAGVFPAFAAQRLGSRLRERSRHSSPADIVGLPVVSPTVERVLMGLCRLDELLLPRYDLAFGSSVMVAAERIGPATAPSVVAARES
jgi:SAM-dependent methyltransferase